LAFYLNPLWLTEVDRRFAQSAHPKFFTRPVAFLSHRLARLRDDVLDSLGQHEPPSTRVIEELIAAVFAEVKILTLPLSRLYPAGAHGELGYDARIRHVVESMLEGGSAPVGLEEVALSVGLSRAHFFRLFRRSTGLAPTTFVNMYRMEACLKSVARRETPLQDIAAQLGFDTAGNFTRFFSGQQGVAPSKYRKVVEVVDPDKL
jgi:AraC-like DNA-binding protein